MKNYHAHVYFDLRDGELAENLFRKAQSQGAILKPWKIYDRSVGPHALPMIELHFTEATKLEAIKWLRDNIGDWSALIHEDSGDDVRDHSEGALWLGAPLPIDFTFFEVVRKNPKLALHQN
jgi:aromatic ring-cleaving dioxygenase